MKYYNTLLNRRLMLRGMMSGAAVSVGLPLLDCFLNSNGTALADGNKLPYASAHGSLVSGSITADGNPRSSAPITT